MIAVDGRDLTVGQGEIFRFLGPHGAHKATTLRMLLRLIRTMGMPAPSPAGFTADGGR